MEEISLSSPLNGKCMHVDCEAKGENANDAVVEIEMRVVKKRADGGQVCVGTAYCAEHRDQVLDSLKEADKVLLETDNGDVEGQIKQAARRRTGYIFG